jgi:hypothetical protein
MFLGHFAVAFAAKRAAPGVSLGALFLAAQLADLVWPVLVLAGVERFEVRPGITAFTPLDFIHYPYSHSFVALAAWGAAFAALYYALRRSGARPALLLAALVLSHWVLDVASHRPDMPLTLGGTARVGLGLWNSVPATLIVEFALFAAGVYLYARTTRALDRIGRFGFHGLVAFLALAYIASFAGPPPPSVEAVAWSALAMWLLVGWGYWIDRHRTVAAMPAREIPVT